MYCAEKFEWDQGIIIDDDLIRHYCDPALLDLSRMRKRADLRGSHPLPSTIELGEGESLVE
jgi:hypothetical protein